jgi:hypothetical protein
MDLVRDVLRKIEQDPLMDNSDERQTSAEYFGVGDVRAAELKYDLRLLIENGFVQGNADALYEMPLVAGLTWKGHEFIADITDPDIWAKTKERIGVLSNVAIAFVWEIAKSEIKQRLGL